MADEFMEANPNVQINITVSENEAFKAALQTISRPVRAGPLSSPGVAVASARGGGRLDAKIITELPPSSSAERGRVGLYQRG